MKVKLNAPDDLVEALEEAALVDNPVTEEQDPLVSAMANLLSILLERINDKSVNKIENPIPYPS